jgi:Polysaccharide lyase family 4, domain II
MRRIGFMIAVAGVVGLLTAPMASAKKGPEYAGGAVSNGGSISGKIKFTGTPQAPKQFDLVKFPNSTYCAQNPFSDGKGHIELPEVNVKDGALRDVVVYIPHIEKGKPFDFKGTDVKANLCRFLAQGGPSTFSGVVMNKSHIRVLNTDADPNDPKAATGVLHNPHTYEIDGTKSKTIFNVPLPNKGQTIDKEVKLRKEDKGSFVKLECDQHNFMNAYFLPVSNPYYAVVSEDGTFKIDDIPPGEYEVEAWHPILGVQEAKIKVAAGGTATAEFTFKQ